MEFVFVVERTRLFDLAFPQGLVQASVQREQVGRYVQRIRQHGFFLERRKAEEDSRFKQIIPYVVIDRGDAVLLLERKNKQGESRLHGKLSVGIGGHINPVDESEGDVLLTGLLREVKEELHVQGPLPLRVAGLLNDDASEVGSVHFGLVVVADASQAEVSIRETEMMDGRFVSHDELRRLAREEGGRFETWSAFLVQELDSVLAADLPLEAALAAGNG